MSHENQYMIIWWNYIVQIVISDVAVLGNWNSHIYIVNDANCQKHTQWFWNGLMDRIRIWYLLHQCYDMWNGYGNTLLNYTFFVWKPEQLFLCKILVVCIALYSIRKWILCIGSFMLYALCFMKQSMPSIYPFFYCNTK